MSASRVVFASTLAAATDEQVMSALIRMVTGGGSTTASRSATSPSSSNSAGAGRLTQSYLPSSSTWSGRTGSWAKARSPASRRARRMPSASISAALACATAQAGAQRRSLGTIRSRAAGVSSLESRTPDGAERVSRSTSTTPTVTGPPSAPRPTSSTEASQRIPWARSISRSTRSDGAALTAAPPPPTRTGAGGGPSRSRSSSRSAMSGGATMTEPSDVGSARSSSTENQA